jgi:hypothetical protein
MSNMSYCRFRNTLTDLVDCQEAILDELSLDEAAARKHLIKVAFEIVQDFITNDGRLDMEAVDQLPVEEN